MGKKCLVTVLLVMLWLHSTTITHASDINIDNGGGGFGTVVSGYTWSGGEGVRVTVINTSDSKAVTMPIDLCNQRQSGVKAHFGKNCKISYREGTSLIPKTNTYRNSIPTVQMPRIISGNSNQADLDEIKKYFCSEYVIKAIVEYTGMDYEEMISGEYKLLLEPIVYAKVGGVYTAMTAHEAALYDEIMGGTLESKMPSLTHKNLPLSMFLTYDDLGIGAWNGSKTDRVTNAQIKNYLGAAVIKFRDVPSNVEVVVEDVTYHCDTDVITSIYVSTDIDRTTKNPITVTFYVLGTSYQVTNVVIPAGSSQIVWCKWHTPSTASTVNIQVSVSGGTTAKSAITAKLKKLKEKVPPNPTANSEKPSGYYVPASLSTNHDARCEWSVWNCKWIPDWKWVSDWEWISTGVDKKGVPIGYWIDNGYWYDFGKWFYDTINYYAILSTNMELVPSDKVPTAIGTTMKSGYGVKLDINSSVSSNAERTAITGAQNAIAYFPEFQYETYWRVLEEMTSGYHANFQFKANKYSTYNNRVHFTPIWYPDGKYMVHIKLIDMWTPTGMLSCRLNDEITIDGSLYDDWHISSKN